MFESMQRFFQNNMASATDAAAEQRGLQVATCALLLEAAHADDTFSADERQRIVELLGRRFGLAGDEVGELIELAEQARAEQPDIYHFARLINEHYARSRKLAVLELLWDVVYSDGVLAAHEDALMHRLSNVLGLSHKEFIAVKLQVRKRLLGDD